MKQITRLICGIVILTVPSIEYGGIFLLNLISGYEEDMALTDFQEAMFRAGHAHAGVLVIFALVALILSDDAHLPSFGLWLIRLGFPLSAILISGGFFAAAIGPQLKEPNEWIAILYLGVCLLGLALISLGIGLVRKPPLEN